MISILNVSCEIDFTTQTPVPAILMLRPRSGAAQWIASERYQFEPRVPIVEYTDMFGNLCQRTVVQPGHSRVRTECVVETPDTVDMDLSAAFVPAEQLPDNCLHFLMASRFCPSDLLGKLASEVTQGVAPGYPQVEAIRTWIHQNVEYRYGASTATTTAVETANDRSGVCRDFAHLGIALCRAVNIPARIVAGYSYALKQPDLHAWFEAFVGGRWYAFDATEDTTTGQRVAIAFGRDAVDVAIVTQFGPLVLDRLEVKVDLAKT